MTLAHDIRHALSHDAQTEQTALGVALLRSRLEVESKADETPVTIADRAVEAMLRERIEATFPDHGIAGEEFGHRNPGADWTWHLDPIDGTKSFLSGALGFGTQIALGWRGRPLLGLIDQPITEERWVSATPTQTTHNGVPARVSGKTALNDAILYTSDPAVFDPVQAPCFDALRRAVRLTRYSHDCYAAGFLAMGHIDLLVEANVYPYDIAAMIPVIEGAGGIARSWNGGEIALDARLCMVADSTEAILQKALEMLAPKN